MSDPVLPLLVAILVALLAVGGLGAFLPGSGRQVIGFAATGIGGLGCLLALMVLLLGNDPAGADLPIGPPGMALHLVLDPLSAFFLLAVFLSGTAGLAFAAETPLSEAPVTLAGLAVCIAGLGLAVLAADPVALATGLAIAGGALWATGEPGRPRALLLAVIPGAGVLMAAAVALFAPPAGALQFEALRATTPDPGPAAAALALTLAGAGALAGLVPLHAWLMPAHAAAPARVGALLSGGVVPVGFYLMLRIPLDLAGATPPLWWGLPFLLMGAASTVTGGWRGATESTIDSVLAAGTHRVSGLAATGIGLALFGRSADLPNLVALALGAVLLLSIGQAVCATLVLLTAGAVRHEAGTRRLNRLGGLIRQMPVAALAMAAGLFGLLAVPPGIGFAGSWMLFQSLLAAPRAGGLAPQILLAGLAGVLGLSGALGVVAAVRVFGVAFLGRPRNARASSAGDVPRGARPALYALAGIAAVLSLLPGAALRVLAEPAIRLLADTGLGPRAGLLGLASGAETPGYAALPLAALVALCGGATLWLLRRRTPQERAVPAWNDGFAPPPAWLPFGDPLTQADGSGFVPELPAWPHRFARPGWLALTRLLPVHAAGLWLVLAVIAVLLALLTVFGPS